MAHAQVDYIKTLNNKAITVLSAPRLGVALHAHTISLRHRYPQQEHIKSYEPLHAQVKALSPLHFC